MKKTVIELENIIISILKKIIENSNIDINPHTNLKDLNLDSLNAMMFISNLEEELQIPSSVKLEPYMVYIYPTAREFAGYLENCLRELQ